MSPKHYYATDDIDFIPFETEKPKEKKKRKKDKSYTPTHSKPKKRFI